MDDNRTMAQLLEAPTAGYEDAIVVPEITADNFELKHAPAPNSRVSKEDFQAYVKANDAVMRNMQTQGQNMQNQLTNLTDMLSKFVTSNTASTSGTLPSNTVTNPKEDLKGITTRSGVAYKGPTIHTTSSPKVVEREPEVTKDTMLPTNNGSTEDVQPPVVPVVHHESISEPVNAPVSASRPNQKASIPFPSRRNDERRREKANDQIEKFYEIFRDLSFEISFTDALMLMPKFASTLKTLIGNKEKLSEMARTPLNENCLIVSSAITTPYYDPIVSTVSPTLTPFGDSDFLLFEEADSFLAIEDDPTSPEVDPTYYDPDGDILLLEAILNINEPPEVELKDLPPHLEYAFLRYSDREVCASIFRRVELRLPNGTTFASLPWTKCCKSRPGNQFYCFLDGFSGYFQIPIDPKDQEKTTFTCPYGTFAYRRMPFGLCNAPGTFQRCMMAIFHDMIEKTMEVFMDDFSVFGDSFSTCLSHLDKMLKRCEDTNLVLNWEKSHFMVKEGIVLGHKISKSGIEVDRAKVDVIAKLPHPTTDCPDFEASRARGFCPSITRASNPQLHLGIRYPNLID
ncbi:reverse transcriptase domain-containing protein [Tanacetum coccineum]